MDRVSIKLKSAPRAFTSDALSSLRAISKLLITFWTSGSHQGVTSEAFVRFIYILFIRIFFSLSLFFSFARQHEASSVLAKFHDFSTRH